MAADNDARPVTFRDVLAIREFCALYVAQTLSVVGDQFARIAIASLVFARTGSALLTGVSYAISYLPWVIGGPVLSIAADRCPRRSVMITCDLVRAGLLAVVALTGLPIWAFLVFVALVTLLEPPFAAARASAIPDVVGENQYGTAATLGNTTNQLCVVIGFAVGGTMTASFGAHLTVAFDAGTFLLSAAIVGRWMQWRPAACSPQQRRWSEELRCGTRVIRNDAQLVWLVATSCVVVGAVIGTEAVAVPYAHAHGGGPVCAGLLTATLPAGTTFGSLILGRTVSAETAERLMSKLAMCCPLVLSLTAFNPSPVVAGTVWFCAGTFGAMTVVANRMFVVRVPEESRGRAFGVAAAGIATAQGAGTLLAGLIAHRLNPAIAVSVVAIGAFGAITLLSTGSGHGLFSRGSRSMQRGTGRMARPSLPQHR